MAKTLSDYLAEISPAPFQYDVIDCWLFCLLWVDDQTGVDGATQWRGRYTDHLSCRDFISRNGGMRKIASAFLSETYGIAEANEQRRGNIVLATMAGVTAFGLRVSETDCSFKLEGGVLVTKRSKILHEWGVPCRNC